MNIQLNICESSYARYYRRASLCYQKPLSQTHHYPALALRIHNAELSTWAFADVVGSEKLIHSMDEHEEGTRSFPRPDRKALVKRNVGIFSARRDRGYTGLASYSRDPNLVIKTVFISQPDPQRGERMKPDPQALQAWANSIFGALLIIPSENNYYLTGPPSRVACHGAAGTRETASFLIQSRHHQWQ
jgi:hypothetical protein